MTKRIYRVRITDYPASMKERGNDYTTLSTWAPDGWEPDAAYLRMHPDGLFRWPSTRHLYRSRSAALDRAHLIEFYGATCVVESADLKWEEIGKAVRRRAAERDLARAERLEAQAAILRDRALGGESR
ncbi:MAG: hypothetical protein SO046_02845 [Actinomyces urogenitalis]|uniref:hypothetical protein n=1 Tax=Actinomyces urogenitalis TaxID=103621 RepID=UPI002A83F017|nr:hypothetical protein [Actinomyces urogenitalis]MDY3678142.1 hypothetical protein [Actinomyces urogenitalis]